MDLLGRVLLFGLLAVLLICGAGVAGLTWLWSSSVVSTVGEVDFVNRLAVPPLAPSRVDGAGRRVFDLTAAEGRHDFGNGPVATWGFNGGYLGPTLRARRGEQVLVNVRNRLGEPTTVHWHGMHLPPEMDGGPHQTIPAGDTWSPTWRIDQPAATLWYHPHLHTETSRHVYQGLAGMFILDDPRTSTPDLPHRYGVDDIPLIVQDRKFDGDALDDAPNRLGGVGVLGDTIAVNGTVGPYLKFSTERVRLRLLNGSNARVYDFGFADNRRFAVVATDGGLLETAYRTTRVMLSPGERAEIVVGVRPGERTVLRSYPPPLGLDGIAGRFVGGADSFDVLQVRAAARLAERPEVPKRLVDVPRLDPGDAAEHRTFRLLGHSVNGGQMAMGRVDTTVVKGATEVWEVTNSDGTPHTFHVHDVQFQVVSVAGMPPPPELRGWKDTVYLRPQEPVEIVMRFADYADPDTPYMYHCHVLFHEDQGMMGQFVVVEPGQAAGSPGSGHHHGD